MKLYGLIGYPLTHSFSAGYFTRKFENEGIANCQYRNFPLENIGLFKKLIEDNTDLCGLNVTIPYKEQVMQYLDELDPATKSIGAVNVIKFIRNGSLLKLVGYNSDEYGFRNSINKHLNETHKAALVLGTGGASKAVIYALKSLGMEVKLVSRTPKGIDQLAYTELDSQKMNHYKVIVNTTPLGMSPNIESCPDIPYQLLTNNHVLFDAVYNPSETLFLKKGKEQGASILNGLEMLHLQAERAWRIWNEL